MPSRNVTPRIALGNRFPPDQPAPGFRGGGDQLEDHQPGGFRRQGGCDVCRFGKSLAFADDADGLWVEGGRGRLLGPR